MKGMARHNRDGDQEYVPLGIHWPIGQAMSITNCDFVIDVSTAAGSTTAVGIFMEDGSGGSVSDLTFVGGNIGFFAGSQQFTAVNLQFTSCLTVIKHPWNWGFIWKNIYVLSCYIAIDCTDYSESTNPPQGTGSITVLDSHFNGAPYAITVGRLEHQYPSIMLENILVENSQSIVLVSGGDTVLAGSGGPLYFTSWASGYQVLPNGVSGKRTGSMNTAPQKPAALLNSSGGYMYRSKPQYADAGSVVVATDHGVSNDATGDQTAAMNSLLSGNVGSVIFSPGGVYLVKGTVEVPAGSKMVGSGWSQIMATGEYFGDEFQPQVMVRVGQKGGNGVVEISDMLFATRVGTIGCILMEWNIHESQQGSAAIWDSHFRVGGGKGTDLVLADCPIHTSSPLDKCRAAAMMLHVTGTASGFFDNLWVWVADHDLDDPLNAQAYNGPNGIPEGVLTQISVYVGRGVLIESKEPSWWWGCGSEHAQLYQWQLLRAANVFMGHVQTETPYYQENPTALAPYTVGEWPSDPTFGECADDYCKKAWALRVVDSRAVFLYGLGMYSFFQDNNLGCASGDRCQLGLIETSFSENVWLYNIFTKGSLQVVTPQGDLPALLLNDADPEHNSTSHPINTRTITPRPWPWPKSESESGPSSTTISSTSSSDDSLYPIVLFHTAGPPNPTCLANCGHSCKIFCSFPCLLLCPGDTLQGTYRSAHDHKPRFLISFLDPLDPPDTSSGQISTTMTTPTSPLRRVVTARKGASVRLSRSARACVYWQRVHRRAHPPAAMSLVALPQPLMLRPPSRLLPTPTSTPRSLNLGPQATPQASSTP